MELTWIKENTCVLTSGKSINIAINPHKSFTSKNANIVVLTNEDKSLYGKIEEKAYVVDWPGEYEIADTLINGFEVEENTLLLQTIYSLHLPEDISIAVVGDITKPLTGEQVEHLGSTDVLILSLKNLDPKDAHKIVDHIEPKFIVPVGYSEESVLENFLKTMGNIARPEVKNSLKLTKADIPEEGQAVVLLSHE